MEQSLMELAQRALKGLLIDGDLPNFMSKFERQKTYEEKFALLWDLKGMQEMLTLPMVKSEKSELEANRLRSEGNSYYKKKNFGKALELFNLSIMASPHPVIHGSTTAHQETSRGDGMFACPSIDPMLYGGVPKSESKALALGYANRSALMFELRFYEKCLIDINLAFESGYPEELHLKLHNRKEKCMKFLSSDSPLTDKDLSSSRKAENCFTVTGSESLKNGSDGLKIIAGKSTSVYSDLQSKHIVLENLLMMKHRHTPKLVKSNPEIPAFSDAVGMTYTTSKGRGLIALRNIRPGDVIGVERAYCVSLHSHMLSSYCSSCLEMCLNPVPCPSCSKVVYCNELCRMTGLAEDHWIECRILPTLITFETVTFFAFGHKMLKNFTCGQLKCMIKELQRERLDCPEKLGYNSEGLYSSTSYQAVYHLCTAPEWETSKLFFAWLDSVAITKVLQQSGRYFVNIDNEAVDPSRDDIIVTGAAIFSHMMKAHVNLFELADAQVGKGVGSGVFPALSLINHSCNHGALHYNCGRTLVVRANKPIKAGEEITVTYAHSFWQRERKLREEHLKGYGINCTCEACKNNWPLLGDLPRCNWKCLTCLQSLEGDNFLCDDCLLPLTLEQIAKGRLELYNRVHNLDKDMSLIFSKLVNREVTKEQIKFLFETIEALYKFEAEPSQRHCNLTAMLRIAFRSGF